RRALERGLGRVPLEPLVVAGAGLRSARGRGGAPRRSLAVAAPTRAPPAARRDDESAPRRVLLQQRAARASRGGGASGRPPPLLGLVSRGARGHRRRGADLRRALARRPVARGLAVAPARQLVDERV